MSYRITPEELTTLQERVVVLGEQSPCQEKIATFCGPESVNQNLPMPLQLQEPLLANLPPPPSNAAEFAQWAGSLVELSEQRGRIDGETVGVAKCRTDGGRWESPEEGPGRARGEAVGIAKVEAEREQQTS